MSEWIPVGIKLPSSNDTKVEVVYLRPSWGFFDPTVELGYYDKPDDYINPNDGKGWLTWHGDREILVTHWRRIGEMPENNFKHVSQEDFIKKHGQRPNLGSVVHNN